MRRHPQMPLTVGTMRRHQRSELIDLDRLVVPPTEDDPVFTRLYLEFVKGNGVAAITRLPRSRIEPGFRRITDTRLVIDEVPFAHLLEERARIRAGARGAVWLYRQHSTSDIRYSCPDDVTLLKAYEAEGIDTLPCVVLEPTSAALEHSALLVKSLRNSSEVAFTEVLQPSEPRVAMLLGIGVKRVRLDVVGGLKMLQSQVERVLRRLRNYHREGRDTPHYHHSFASAVTRAARLLEALRRIDLAAFPDAAAVIVRALYELWLSLYVDWLAPEFIGPAFQVCATSSRQARRNAIRELRDQKRTAGWLDQDIQSYVTARERLLRVVESPAERAKINPAATLHEKIYPRLCQYVHQDFAAGSAFLSSIARKDSPYKTNVCRPKTEALFLLQVTDIAVTGIVSCVREDTGVDS